MAQVVYEITAEVEPLIAAEYSRYMIDEHIPDLMATACFIAADISAADEGRFRIRYIASERQSLDRYLTEHADRLRAHALERFPTGVSLSREVWEVLSVF